MISKLKFMVPEVEVVIIIRYYY